MPPEDLEYPIRINRYLYKLGYCSRRQADEYIERGSVKINGKVAKLGTKVEKGDHVEIGKSIKKIAKSFEYFILNKSRGVISHNPEGDEIDAEMEFKQTKLGKNFKEQVFPIGRLDKDSEGLMLLTNDRRIVDSVLNPKYEHEKEYIVTVDKEINNYFVNRMSYGVDIEGYTTKKCKVRIKNKKSFFIILTEGKKHQIRRMCAALGFQVKKLKRVRMMNIKLGTLPEGEVRKLHTGEKMDLLKDVGVLQKEA